MLSANVIYLHEVCRSHARINGPQSYIQSWVPTLPEFNRIFFYVSSLMLRCLCKIIINANWIYVLGNKNFQTSTNSHVAKKKNNRNNHINTTLFTVRYWNSLKTPWKVTVHWIEWDKDMSPDGESMIDGPSPIMWYHRGCI